jgi:hypothetical protein
VAGQSESCTFAFRVAAAADLIRISTVSFIACSSDTLRRDFSIGAPSLGKGLGSAFSELGIYGTGKKNRSFGFGPSRRAKGPLIQPVPLVENFHCWCKTRFSRDSVAIIVLMCLTTKLNGGD